MKVCAAQTRPFTGDIQRNIAVHQRLVDLAVVNGAEVIIFPELSLTGYEPTLANELAVHQDDHRFDLFQAISDAQHITIGIGAPTKSDGGVCISSILFQPRRDRQLYSKMLLHPDEEDFFVRGQPSVGLIGSDPRAALAICYELSVPEHAANARKNGADIYIASVAKSAGQMEQALERLGEIAREYSMTVVMSNCIGRSDGMECAGRTSVWNKDGTLLDQMDGAKEGIIVMDTESYDVLQHFPDRGW